MHHNVLRYKGIKNAYNSNCILYLYYEIGYVYLCHKDGDFTFGFSYNVKNFFPLFDVNYIEAMISGSNAP